MNDASTDAYCPLHPDQKMISLAYDREGSFCPKCQANLLGEGKPETPKEPQKENVRGPW